METAQPPPPADVRSKKGTPTLSGDPGTGPYAPPPHHLGGVAHPVVGVVPAVWPRGHPPPGTRGGPPRGRPHGAVATYLSYPVIGYIHYITFN